VKRGSSAGENRKKVSTIVNPKLSTGDDLVMHKVHRPGLVR
jgi:hypothetical protein